MKKEIKELVISRILEQSTLKLTRMPFRAQDLTCSLHPKFHLGLSPYAPSALFRKEERIWIKALQLDV